MAGTIITDFIRADANKLSINVGNTVIASVNALGILSTSGNVMISSSGTFDANNVTAGTLGKARLPTGSVLQVVSNTWSATVSSSSTTLVDTGLIVSITPTSATSKILVLFNLSLSGGTNNSMTSRTVLLRDSTTIRDISGTFYDSVQYPTYIASVDSCCLLDSPATTSSVTYKVQISRNSYAGSYGAVVYAGAPTGSGTNAQQITVMEIAG